MSTRQLPTQPNLRHLRNEAKALHRAIAQADGAALALVREHLRRLADFTDAQIVAANVSLQEVQHALASDYGCSDWAALVAAVEPQTTEFALDDLARLSALDAELALRAVDSRDLMQTLVLADEDLTTRILANLSPRMARWVRAEREHERAKSAEVIEASHQRVVEQVRQLAAEGRIAWPPVADDGGSTPMDVPDQTEAANQAGASEIRLLELSGRPVTDMTQDDLVELMCALSDRVIARGWNSAEAIAAQAPEFLGEGIRLIIDGTEPPLVMDLLETRMLPLLQRRRIHMAIMIEALFSIICGDNPRVLAYKIEVMYKDSVALDESMELSPEAFEANVEQLRATLTRGPFFELSLDEMRDFYVCMDIVCRREGIHAIEGLDRLADDPLLPMALRLMHQVDPDAWVAQAEEEMARIIEETYYRYQMAVEGLCAVQSGASTEVIESTIKGVQWKPLDQVRGGRW